MAYRNLVIESPAMISCHNDQLIIMTGEKHSVPIEDINALMLENRQSTITVAALVRLAQTGTVVYMCDDKHLPCAIVNPFLQHTRHVGILRLQEMLSQPRKKRLWQKVVMAKINNQAQCLEYCGKEVEAHYLRQLAETVTSGDVNNVEAVAANYYFKILFGKDFSRDGDDNRNALLNYGYAIMRGHLARLLVVYGFLTAKGIHHNSEQNSFNLADDFMEPFRPVVDLFVISNYEKDVVMKPDIRRKIFNLLNVDMESGNQIHSLSYAAERLVQSFSRCCQNTEETLLLPHLLKYRQHSYE